MLRNQASLGSNARSANPKAPGTDAYMSDLREIEGMVERVKAGYGGAGEVREPLSVVGSGCHFRPLRGLIQIGLAWVKIQIRTWLPEEQAICPKIEDCLRAGWGSCSSNFPFRSRNDVDRHALSWRLLFDSKSGKAVPSNDCPNSGVKGIFLFQPLFNRIHLEVWLGLVCSWVLL